MPRYCILLSFQPACRLCCLEASSIQSTRQAGWGPGCPGGETNSVARLCGRGIDRCRQGGREQRTGERVRSGQQQRQLAGGFAARFGRCPIHMIIGESAGSASSGRLLSALGVGLGNATHSCWPETEPVQQKTAISMANNQRIYSRPAPQQWVKSGLTLPK